MVEVVVSVELPASPADVWSVIEPIEDHVMWMADAAAIRFVGQRRRGVGTRFDCDTRIGPLRLVDRMEITAWEPGRTMGVSHHGLVSGTGQFELEPLPHARTRFTWREVLRFPWYFGGPLGEFVAGRTVLRWVWGRNLRSLQRLVAERVPSPAPA